MSCVTVVSFSEKSRDVRGCEEDSSDSALALEYGYSGSEKDVEIQTE